MPTVGALVTARAVDSDTTDKSVHIAQNDRKMTRRFCRAEGPEPRQPSPTGWVPPTPTI